VSELQLHGLIRGVLLPGAVAGILYVLARFVPGRLRDTFRTTAIAAAVFLAYVLLIGAPSWPLGGSPSGILVAVFLASLWPIFESMVGRRIWLARYLMLAMIAIVVLKPFLTMTWPMAQGAQILLTVTLLALAVWTMVERGAEQMYPAGTLAVLLMMCVGSAVSFGLGGSASLAQIAGALAVAIGVALLLSLLSFLKPGRTELNAAVLPILMALWLCHGFFVEINWMSQAWVLAPLAVFIYRSYIATVPATPFKDALISGLIAAIPVAWGVYSAIQREIPVSTP
jgi:hypothetical protein